VILTQTDKLLKNKQKLLEEMNCIPNPLHDFLKDLLLTLHVVVMQEKTTKMDAQTVAKLIAPTLFTNFFSDATFQLLALLIAEFSYYFGMSQKELAPLYVPPRRCAGREEAAPQGDVHPAGREEARRKRRVGD